MATKTFTLPIRSPHISVTSGGYLDTLGMLAARPTGGGIAEGLLFSTNSSQGGSWQWRMPGDFVSTLVAIPQYVMVSAPTGITDLQFFAMKVSSGSADPDIPSFAAANKATNSGQTVPVSAGNLDELPVSISNDDGVGAGDFFTLVAARIADGNDSAAGDLKMVTLSITYSDT